MNKFAVFIFSLSLFLSSISISSTCLAFSYNYDNDDDLDEASLNYLCAWVSLASYGDRVGLAARGELSSLGFDMVPYREETEKVSAKYFLVRKFTNEGMRLLLSVTGTSGMKDLRNDASIAKVPFGGTTPREFERAARKKEMTSKEPLVHRGFNNYTQEAFFTNAVNGVTIGESIRDTLINDPTAKISITGHSLGGAVAILFAARLIDMGVPSEQINVVTFGAPAVGNESFCTAYKDMHLTRIVMSGDPVASLLPALGAGYAELGEKIVLHPKTPPRFQHEMVLYLDMLMRDYITGGFTSSFIPVDDESSSPEIYLITTVDFDDTIAQDAQYVNLASINVLRRELPPIHVGELPDGLMNGDVMTTICAEARALGCKYVILQAYEGKRIKDKKNVYKISLDEMIVTSDGRPLTVNLYTTSTDDMTPIIAAIYDEICAKESREKALGLDKDE